MIHGGFIGVIDLAGIMAAAMQVADFLISHVRHQRRCLGITPEEFGSGVSAAACFECLILAIETLIHQLNQLAGCVLFQETVPVTAPQALDHIPARAAEQAFEFGDHFAIAAHRAIQALQIAVNNEDQIVEFLARGNRNGTGRFRLVHFAIAQKRPYFARGGFNHFAVFEVPHELRLVNGIDGSEAHGYGGELPEILHQPRVRVRRKARTFAQFVTEIFELLLGQAAFQKSARIDAR